MISKGENGSSEITSLVIIFLMLTFLPMFSSLLGVYTTTANLNQVAKTTVNMAKMVGGFNSDVLNTMDHMLEDLNLDRNNLDVVLTPGANRLANKRDLLSINMTYNKDLEILGFHNRKFLISIEIPVDAKAYSHYYKK